MKTTKRKKLSTKGWSKAEAKKAQAMEAVYRAQNDRAWLTEVSEGLLALEERTLLRSEVIAGLVIPRDPDANRLEYLKRREIELAQTLSNLRRKILWVLEA